MENSFEEYHSVSRSGKRNMKRNLHKNDIRHNLHKNFVMRIQIADK